MYHRQYWLIAAVLIGCLTVAPKTMAQTFSQQTTPGITCMPANFAQGTAFFRYYEARIQNLSFTDAYWVVCQIPRSVAAVAAAAFAPTIWINLHFDSGYDGSQGRCLFRDYFFTNTNRLPDAFDNEFFSRPTTFLPTFDDIFLALNLELDSSFRYWTVACELPPRTGINSIDVNVSDAN